MAATNNDSTRLYWLIFIVSTVACIALLFIKAEWFWVTLPFVFTYLVKALRVV